MLGFGQKTVKTHCFKRVPYTQAKPYDLELVTCPDCLVELRERQKGNALIFAHTEALKRTDRDIQPITKSVDDSTPGFILIEIQYNSKGYSVLYEYRIKDGSISLFI